MRILYVTTRQWNPGDEFILRGVRRLVESAWGVPEVEAIYNKSPQVRGLFEHWNPFRRKSIGRFSGVLDSFLKLTEYDNSLSWFHTIKNFDCVLFAGSPAWFGGRVRDVYQLIERSKVPVGFLGIGTPNKGIKLSAIEARILQRSAISVRNPELEQSLKNLGIKSEYRPCPALFSADQQKVVSGCHKVGLVYTTYKGQRYQAVKKSHYHKQLQGFRSLIDGMKQVEFFLICNYIDEIDEALRDFPGVPVRYHYDAIDYQRMYSDLDLIVSSRVHGCGLASSMGIPNIHLGHDARSSTVSGFKTISGDVSSLLEVAMEVRDRVNSLSVALAEHRSSAMREYVNWLRAINLK